MQSNHSNALAEAERMGIDLSLLRESLKLTPTERLRNFERALVFAEDLRTAVLERKRCSNRKRS